MEKKQIFKSILVIGVILLSILPVIVTFSSVLTTVFLKMQWYVFLQDYVVPFESRLVAVIVKGVGITAKVALEQDFSLVIIKNSGALLPIKLEWNCLGWQSMVLLIITFISGLRGPYTLSSKFEVVIIGVIGTFLINLMRMALIVTLAYYWSSFAAVIIHDYFASFVALIWMLFFWWFSYTYVFTEK